MRTFLLILLNTVLFGDISFSQDLEWAHTIDSSLLNGRVKIAPSGNIYIAGQFQGSRDFNFASASDSVLVATSDADAYVAKYDSFGEFIWAFKLGDVACGGTCGNFIFDIDLDVSENIFIAGQFTVGLDMDPGLAVSNLPNNAGVTDAVIAKYTSAGTFEWAESLGGVGPDKANSVSVTSSNEVVVGGVFSGSADHALGTIVSQGDDDGFVYKLTTSGVPLWVIAIGGPSSTESCEIVDLGTDLSGNIYVTGNTNVPVVDFDPTASSYDVNLVGLQDLFVASYTPSGELRWADSYGAAGKIARAKTLVVDPLADIVAAGQFDGSIDFNPGTGTSTLVAQSNEDVYMAKYDSSGAYQWVNQIGSPTRDRVYSLTVDDVGQLYVVGWIYGTTDFDPTAGVLNVVPFGARCTYAAKFQANGEVLWAHRISEHQTFNAFIDVSVHDESMVLFGAYRDSVDFDILNGSIQTFPAGVSDAYLAKYSVGPTAIPFLSKVGGSVKPNPFSSSFQVSSSSTRGNTHISIHSMAGVLVFERSDVGHSEVITPHIETGLYILTITSEDGAWSTIIIKD